MNHYFLNNISFDLRNETCPVARLQVINTIRYKYNKKLLQVYSWVTCAFIGLEYETQPIRCLLISCQGQFLAG